MDEPRADDARASHDYKRDLRLTRTAKRSLALALVVGVVLGGVLFALAEFFRPAGPQAPAAAPSSATSAKPLAPVTQRAASQAAPPQAAAAVPPASAGRNLVVKCVENGVTTFSDNPCRDGAASEYVPADPNQNLSAGLPRSKIDFSAGNPQAAASRTASAAPDANSLRILKCDALEAQIKAIDVRVKQQVAEEEKERLEALRKRYRGEQVARRC